MIIAIFLLVFTFFFLYLNCRKPKGYPPGPTWWPVLGSALELARIFGETKYVYKMFMKLHNKYGPIVGLKIGKKHIIILNSVQSTREMYFNKDCDGRPNIFYNTGVRRFIMTDGQSWIDQRQFIVRYLRKLGRTGIAALIEDEARKLLEHLKILLEDTEKSSKKNDLDMWELHDKFNVVENGILKDKLRTTIEDDEEVKKVPEAKEVIVEMVDIFKTNLLNTIWKVIFEKCSDHKSRHVNQNIIKTIGTIFKFDLYCKNFVFNDYPILRFIMSKSSDHESFIKAFKEVWNFMEEELQYYKKTLNPNAPRGFVDAYLIALRSEHFGDSLKNESQLIATCLDLFEAGTETTSNSLAFGFLYLILFPRIQKKVQEEIDRVIGLDRLPTLADKSKMPYLQAVVLECVRMFMYRSITIPHRALRDTTILGYKIPKDTLFVVNYNAVLSNDQFYNNPGDFYPERFFDNDGNIIISDNYFPFGLGNHNCLGEIIAKGSLFVVISTLLQKYNVSAVPGELQPSPEDMIDSFASTPKPYKALLSLRT